MECAVARDARRAPSLWTERAIAASITLFLVAQVLLLESVGAIPAQHRLEIWIVTLVLAGLAAQAWLVRRLLPPHSDMLLLMLAWGGFGMLWGWQLDGGLAAMQGHGAHQHMPGMTMTPVYSGWFRWANGMNGLMLLFAFPPSLLWARCLMNYRPYALRLVWVLLLDAAGMVLGMMAGGRLLGHPLGMLLEAPALAHHVAMLIGMLAGMAATMAVRPWLAPIPRRGSALR